MRPPVIASSTAEVKSGVCRAIPASRRTAASTSAAVGNASGVSTALIGTNGSAAIAPQARPFEALEIGAPVETGSLVEAPGGVRQHGVDLAGVGGQVVAGDGRSAITARNIIEQPFELVNIVFDGLLELRIGAVFATDFFERSLPLGGVEPLGESAALATFIALPQ